jgi:hypothetical protein
LILIKVIINFDQETISMNLQQHSKSNPEIILEDINACLLFDADAIKNKSVYY